jgi:RNA polymerase sigma-70 factor (ECF subfamily)
MQSIPEPGKSNQFSPLRPPGEVTAWLRQLPRGDLAVMSRVIRALYGDLRRIAVCRMRGERPGHSLDPDALIGEFYLQLARNPAYHFESRGHFLAFASQQMRRFLVDYARRRRSAKRGGGREKVEIEKCNLATSQDLDQLLIVDGLIDTLAAQEPRMANVVEMRCYGGLSYAEIAEALGITERTAKRDWSFARAWLECALQNDRGRGNDS